MLDLNLKNKSIVLTGADGMLGSCIRDALEKLGAKVFSFDLFNSSTSQALDITNEEEVKRTFKALLDDGNKVDGVVNNAAISYKGDPIDTVDFLNTINTNITGTRNCIIHSVPVLEKNASIVNVSSIYGMLSPDFRIYESNPELYNSSAYGASKAAVNQLTKYYAALYAPKIRVNAVTPGGIWSNHNKTFSDKYSDRVPMKRMAQPEEIVNSIMFLLSPLSSYITGHNLIVDGGMSIW